MTTQAIRPLHGHHTYGKRGSYVEPKRFIPWSDDRNNPQRVQRAVRHKLKKFGLTQEQFNTLLSQQNGLCAICGKPPKRVLAIDHDHVTGRVRGLLCSKCNLNLGFVEKHSAKIAEYLGQ